MVSVSASNSDDAILELYRFSKREKRDRQKDRSREQSKNQSVKKCTNSKTDWSLSLHTIRLLPKFAASNTQLFSGAQFNTHTMLQTICYNITSFQFQQNTIIRATNSNIPHNLNHFSASDCTDLILFEFVLDCLSASFSYLHC
jgi:hypothetical protein